MNAMVLIGDDPLSRLAIFPRNGCAVIEQVFVTPGGSTTTVQFNLGRYEAEAAIKTLAALLPDLTIKRDENGAQP